MMSSLREIIKFKEISRSNITTTCCNIYSTVVIYESPTNAQKYSVCSNCTTIQEVS